MSFNARLVGGLSDRRTPYIEPITSTSLDESDFATESTDQKASLYQRYWPSRKSFILTLLFVGSLFLNGAVKPLYQRGFFCNDSSIHYPVKGDTVSFKLLIAISLIIPGLLIKFCDRKLRKGPNKQLRRDYNPKRRNRKFSDAIPEEDSEDLLDEQTNVDVSAEAITSGRTIDSSSQKDPIKAAMLRSSSTQTSLQTDLIRTPATNESMANQSSVGAFHHFFAGIIATCFLTGLGKITSGRLRPHFMQQCQPENVDCQLAENLNRYIDDFRCLNFEPGSRAQTYITTSWPSGHASVIFYSMIYLSVFLLRTLPRIATLNNVRRSSRLADPLVLFSICTCLMSLAGYVSLTRISDYHHHPTDVLSGCVLGSLVSLYWSSSIPVVVL